MTPSNSELKNILADNRLLGLWRMMAGYRLMYLGAVLGIGLAAALSSGDALLLRYFVDDLLAKGRFDYGLALVGLGFVGLALFQGIFTYLSGRWAAQTAESIARRLRDYLFDHVQKLSFSYHDQMQTGELIQRATSDVDAVRRFFAEQAIGMGRIVLLFLVNLTAVIVLNARLALLSILVVPPLMLISVYFFKKVSQAYEEFQEQEAVLSTTLQENLSGVRVVKAFARQAYERDKFERDNWEQFLKGRQLTLMHAMFWPSTDLLCGGQVLFGLFVGALMTMDGSISLGTYLAYSAMVVRIIWPLRELGRLIAHTSMGLVSYGRVAEIVKEEREPLEEGAHRPAGNVRGQITFDEVCFHYNGDEGRVLQDISFRCEPGQAVALLGSTGSGKSSLVNLLPRFYEYTGGRLELDGVDLKDYPRHYLRRQIGIVEQEPFLFSRSIRENITYGIGWDASQAEIEAAARAAAIHDVITSFPEGYDTLVGERGVTLSGGQKQRVAIARTLLKDPRILILDDATSSVDTETEGEIRQAMQRLMKGRTTFIIAHRVQSVMNADLILVLDRGRIVQHGTHDELLAQPGIYRRIYEMQARIEQDLEEEVNQTEISQSWDAWKATPLWEGVVADVAL
jgi:ATP-binding cassette subfamily B protein